MLFIDDMFMHGDILHIIFGRKIEKTLNSSSQNMKK